MRCKICDQLLNDYEATKKDTETKEYLDTCSHCQTTTKTYILDDIEDEEDIFLKTLDKRQKV